MRSAPPADAVLLLASNHPNSFFDALVIATHLPHQMRFLARGDAFRDPRVAKVLRALFMIPIYRMSEGRTELKRTADSFDQAQKDLEGGGSVLVFSEGLSVNEPGLRPLGKGTARITYRAWQSGLDMQVLPIWLRYDTFHRPFMDVCISTGGIMEKRTPGPGSEAVFLRQFNSDLRERLLSTSATVDLARAYELTQRPSALRGIYHGLLAFPAMVGLILHAPWYFSLRTFTTGKTRGSVFFDSVLFGLLFLTYPLWLLALVGIGSWSGLGGWAVAVAVLAPLSLLALRGFSLR
ncbi:MAG: 1-acyl-sn-glycerol-3-phosphate acyltransferase [Flavobacteriales bacterium]